jgi:alpha 1,3-mannosyltransferase
MLLLLILIPVMYLFYSGGPSSTIQPSVVSTGHQPVQNAPNTESIFHAPQADSSSQQHQFSSNSDKDGVRSSQNTHLESPVVASPPHQYETPGTKSGGSSSGSRYRPKTDPDEDEYVPSKYEEPAATPKSYSSGGKSSGSSTGLTTSSTFSERPKFEKALARVIGMLPGEMEGRDLLRPVEGTGKEKLREMGLRTREYKKFLEAWEELHLTFDEEGGAHVRDDVIQYLRHHQHDSTEEDLSESSLAQTIHSYEAYRYFLVKFGQLLFPWTAPYFGDHMTLHSHFRKGGRGIVLTAGDDQAPFLLTIIPTFRKLGCDLPIEVMYLGESDLSEDYRSDLEALDGVVTRDIAQMVNDEGWKLAGWAAKPFAILYSSFREAIFIDADSLFFKSPEVLFEDPAYVKTGALFFKDRLIMPENKKRWLQQILPKPISRQVKQSRMWTGDSGHMQESGVVVVDKWRHFVALMFVTRMNGPDRDGNKEEGRVGVYDMVYGELQLLSYN